MRFEEGKMPDFLSRNSKITSDMAQENLNAVAGFERQFLRERSTVDRLGETLAGIAGGFGFIAFHLSWFGAWIVVNLDLIPGFPVFDKFPFGILHTLVATEAILLSSFVLMKENRIERQSQQRSHLALQVALLVERETTKTLFMVQSICDHLGLELEAQDQEAQKLSEKTHLATLASELKQKIPDG
jgi:uncharacterized membrane protein